ncbi:tyrosinase precursor [Podospora didyma]|uniref:tyrosinase n=1 Tax=Podospora didyma TaxID=330526 RepID=A0AAE0U937_9PEZI|nr:tyrosinase precursor [Podospora didyma]
MRFSSAALLGLAPWQVVQSHAETLASQYTGESAAAYQAAAQTLRWPYWDWAVSVESAALPPATTAPTFEINTPTGPVTMRNPLYSYKFQNYPFQDPDFTSSILSNFNETKRSVDFSEDSDAPNDFAAANQALQSNQPQLKDQVYSVFTQSPLFESMSSTASRGPSFESPHNSVHTDIGGFNFSRVAHMQYVPWSSFDPLFWLHHTNVDRHFAMWQAIYYNNTMFNSTQNGRALFGTASGPIDASSPLKPFTKADGTFYSSRDVTSTRTFGYTYPGVNDWALSPEDLSKQVIAQVNTLYGRQLKTTVAAAAKKRSIVRNRLRDFLKVPELKEYSAAVSVDRANLHLPCTIEFYIADQKAGEFALLAMPTTGVGYSSVPLRRTLEELNFTPLDDPVTVVNMLKKTLRVVVKEADGSETPAASIPSLVVEIEDRSYTPPAAQDQFPKYGSITAHPVNVGDLS